MKIVVPVLSVGPSGGYRVICELASAWVRTGHTVVILAHWKGQTSYFPTCAEIVWVDERGVWVDPDTAMHPARRAGFDHVYRNLMALWRGLDREAGDADVVLANHSLTAWPVFLSRTRGRKFYYIQAYEAETHQLRGFRQWILNSAAFASYFLPLRRIGNAPLYLRYKNLRTKDFVPAGIDLSVMFPKEQEPSWESRSIILGCLGRREPYKGIAEVLDAFDLLLKRKCPVELYVAYGDLPDGRQLPPHSKVVVPKNDRELGAFYRSLDILIAPGRLQQGSTHYPVMEAMACGVPVITTGYLPASTEANNAWIVPVKNPVAIADAVEGIIANPTLRAERVHNALRDIQSFSWDRVAPKMLSLFNT